jgi:hypothetical protein
MISTHGLVAFIDLLGFKDLIGRANDTSRLAVLNLLKSLTAQKRNADYSYEKCSPHSEILHIRPAITAFSDNIAISFEAAHIQNDFAYSTAFELTSRIAGKIACEAFKVGCLIRGGIAVGEIWHQDGVVFGGGLVKAYTLEATASIYPRIVVSHEALVPGITLPIKQDRD